MIAPDEVVTMIKSNFSDAKVDILDKTGMSDHFIIRVVSAQFDGLNAMDRHRKVMSCLKDAMSEGRLHAAEIQTALP